jgi:hypothetical protein
MQGSGSCWKTVMQNAGKNYNLRVLPNRKYFNLKYSLDELTPLVLYASNNCHFVPGSANPGPVMIELDIFVCSWDLR